MNRGRHTGFPGSLLRDAHLLCELHWRGLVELPDVVRWLRSRPGFDTLRLVAEIARHDRLPEDYVAAALAAGVDAEDVVDMGAKCE